MDFSSVRRALESLERRQPPLSDDCLAVVNRVRVGLLEGDTARSEEDLLASLQELLTTEYVTTSSNNNEEAPQSKKIRWEPLAVALLVSTELLQQQNSTSSSSSIEESSHYYQHYFGSRSNVHGRSSYARRGCYECDCRATPVRTGSCRAVPENGGAIKQ